MTVAIQLFQISPFTFSNRSQYLSNNEVFFSNLWKFDTLIWDYQKRQFFIAFGRPKLWLNIRFWQSSHRISRYSRSPEHKNIDMEVSNTLYSKWIHDTRMWPHSLAYNLFMIFEFSHHQEWRFDLNCSKFTWLKLNFVYTQHKHKWRVKKQTLLLVFSQKKFDTIFLKKKKFSGFLLYIDSSNCVSLLHCSIALETVWLWNRTRPVIISKYFICNMRFFQKKRNSDSA